MNKRRIDISLIDKYLKGELDEKSMHQLERRAQDDPFLMDAMEGYEKAGANQHKELNELYDRLHERIAKKKNRIITLKFMSIAASVLIVLSAGGLLLYNNYHSGNFPKQAQVIKTPAKIISPDTVTPVADAMVTNNTLQPSLSKAKPQEQYIANEKAITPRSVVAPDSRIASQGKDSALKDTTPLDEVVVVGYTAQRKKDVTAAVAAVTPQNIKTYKTDSTTRSLQGQAAGVRVTNSGSPGQIALSKNIIKGRVVDKTDGSAIPGATVKIAGTHTATQTDANGAFSLKAKKSKTSLVINYIGYQTLKINANNPDSTKTIELEPSNNTLSEVVVTDYTSKNKDAVDDVTVVAHPKNSWKTFNKYLKENAVSPDGKTGVVKLSFEVDHDGTLGEIKVIKGLSQPTDQKAIDLIKKGSDWIGNANGLPEKITIRVKFENK
ncbi:MAG TPA: carboxypeptidase-like regulatory domain-containing protein [Mucilaginibacter sp.]